MKEDPMNVVQSTSAASPVPPLSPELIERFRTIVGDKYAVTDAADIAPYLTEERELFHGRSPLVLRPGSTAEISAICKLATAQFCVLGSTSVSGPGQNASASRVATASNRAIFRAAARSSTWVISGLKAGRPLAW